MELLSIIQYSVFKNYNYERGFNNTLLKEIHNIELDSIIRYQGKTFIQNGSHTHCAQKIRKQNKHQRRWAAWTSNR